MSEDRVLIEKVKQIIMSDCIDSFLVTNAEICRYLKRKRTGFMPTFESLDSRLKIQEAVKMAVDELVREGRVLKIGKSIRKNKK